MKKKETAVRKKKNPFFQLLKIVGLILLIIILVLAAWILYSGLNKKSSLSLLPANFGLYLHTDSLWQAVNPLLDLQAADILLADEEFSSFRPLFMELRQSKLRESKLLSLAASRPVDVGLYLEDNKTNFVAVVDMGFFSAATRLAKLWVGKIPLGKTFPEGVTLVQGSNGHYFEVTMESNSIFFKNHYNTVIFSSSRELFQQSVLGNNDALYSPEELELLTKKTGEPVQIVADAKNLLQEATEKSPTLQKIISLIGEETKSLVSFGITDKEISLKLHLPLTLDANSDNYLQTERMRTLLQKDSSLPLLLSQLGNNIQYYTILNLGPLDQLKDAVFPLLPESLDAQALWNTADSLSASFFGVNLEELIFSWTGQECAVLGVEGLNSPVIALEVKEESKRQFIFEQLLSSIIIKDDTSLILNGVRLPQLQLPVFFQGVLKLFNISLPNPYYMVHNGFLYLSESPEALSALFTAMQSGQRLSNNESWRLVSEDHKKEASASLFYDLEQEIPFFLRGDSEIVQILELYSVGLLDLQIQDNTLVCQLSATAQSASHLRALPGFPKVLEGRAGQLHKFSDRTGSYIFWVEDNTNLKVMNIGSMAVETKEFRSPIVVTAATENPVSGAIWAVTAEGAVYLLKADLTDVPNFPQLSGSNPATVPVATESGLVQPTDDQELCFVNYQGLVEKLPLELSGSIMAPPSLLKTHAALYDKGFSGGLLVVDLESKSLLLRQQVFGIAYSSPALLERQQMSYLGFVTQAGRLNLWRFTHDDKASPINLEQVVDTSLNGVFFTNLVSNGKFFFALSSEGQVFRIATDGTVISVKLPNVTARTGTITVIPDSKTGEQNIYLGVDGNVLYGFNENLELLPGFPLAGSGVPIFVDVNSDGREDCIALTIDNKLNGWNIR